jgi:putative membrane protein
MMASDGNPDTGDTEPLPSQPPVLPPALPAESTTPQVPSGSPVPPPLFAGRLHPLTLVISAVKAIRAFAIPAVFVLLTGSGATLGLLLLVALGLNVLFAVVRYVTFSYRLQGGELITRQGLLSRQERHIPLGRVQDLRLEAGPVHRLLGVVDVHVETAGGQGVEAALSVLARGDAESLRQAVFEAAGRLPASEGDGEETGQVLVKLSWRDLVVEGLTSNRAASVFVLLGAAWGFADNFFPQDQWQAWMAKLGQGAEQWLAHDGSAQWRGILLTAGAILVLSTVFSVVGSIILFHGFSLVRRGEDLFRTYGLLTRRASSLPRRRIQVLQVQEPLLRRWLGLMVVRADTAARRAGGEEEQRGGRDVLVPLARRENMRLLLPELAPDLGSEPERWERVAPCAVRRATKKGALACLLLALVLAAGPLRIWGLTAQLQALWLVALIPLIYWISRRNYWHLGFADGGTVFRTRRGWLDRTTHVVPVRNLQVMILRQTPWDRHYGVWTLKLDTAGQAYTGGGPALRNVPAQVARITSQSLAVRAAETRYRV